ncbi:MAG: hypothetical protein INR71_06460, partial [Terriglobus roseus]|nr:hypothetical protein [Terriglobus roseus]
LSLAGGLVPLQAQDQALVRALAGSLERVCLALRDAETGQYAGKVLRRRLDDARRALDGPADGDGDGPAAAGS